MQNRPLSRRHFLTLSGGALAAGLLGRGHAQHETVRLGFVLPLRTGQQTSLANTQELAGEAAYKGAIMGGEDYGVSGGLEEKTLEVVTSSAPDEAAALRAAERLGAAGEVHALFGGFGEGQAHALSAVAESRKLLFFNIGSASDALRGEACTRYTFHVEASATMYLDALTGWFTQAGFQDWLFVYPETKEGDALYRRAQEALLKWSGGADEARGVSVPEVPVYHEAVEVIRRAEPQVVLLLLDAQAQLDFLGHYAAAGLESTIIGFPYPVTQTRDFLIASKDVAPQGVSSYHAALWEATLAAHGARGLNERFFERWGTPMDSPAWAAYQSVKIMSKAISVVDTVGGTELAEYLKSPRATFDVQKGTGSSFSPWDHQLSQPLYLVRGNPVAERPLAMADLVGELPAHMPSTNSVGRSRQLGVQGNARCQP